MKMFLEMLLLILGVILVIYIFFNFVPTVLAPKYQQGSVCFKESCFKVELAETTTQRERGLMYRKELDKDRGMLFIFNKEGIYPFWMKNTLIPLDIVWIGADSQVVFISQNVQPCKTLICPLITPTAKAKYVLEINALTCQEIGLKVGDELKINLVN